MIFCLTMNFSKTCLSKFLVSSPSQGGLPQLTPSKLKLLKFLLFQCKFPQKILQKDSKCLRKPCKPLIKLDKNDKFSSCFANFHRSCVMVLKSSPSSVPSADRSILGPPLLSSPMLDPDYEEQFLWEPRYMYTIFLLYSNSNNDKNR